MTTIFSGLPNTSARVFSYFRAFFFSSKNRSILWLTQNSSDKDEVLLNLSFWSETLGATRFSLFTHPEWADFWNWRESGGILLLTYEELIAPTLPHPSSESLFHLSLIVGQIISLKKCFSDLSTWGYEMDTVASAPGVMARRGGILDVYPMNRKGVFRFEWENETLGTITDVESAQQLHSAVIPAFRLPREVLKDGILNYLQKNVQTIIVDPEVASELPFWLKISSAINKTDLITFQTFPASSTVQNVFHFESPPSFHNRLSEAQQELSDMVRNGYKLIIATEDPKKVRALFADISEFTLGPWEHGIESFLWTDRKVVFLTDREIFGERLKTHSLPISHQEAWLHDLNYGDYVVHLDHGIGRFRGMAVLKVDSIDKEYFSLEYAASDRLLVPVDMAGKLDKYIGQPHPKIHRLSEASWHHITVKVKKDALKVAQGLLKLYAERSTVKAPIFPPTNEEMAVISSFDFEETSDQKQAISDVLHDLETHSPTDRLVCGDVGFGKTEVAIRAAARVIFSGWQVAVLAPTTVLAQQHFDTFSARFEKTPLRVRLLSRFQTAAQQKAIIQEMLSGALDIVIGTHRLLQKDVSFHKLGLVIIDEEQRFGVKDKERLKVLKRNAHVVTLTATPIPRTLHMAFSGLREISIIRTPPEGRLPIATTIAPYDESMIISALRVEIERGGQVYFLHNHVETIEKRAKLLQNIFLPAKISIAHGQLPEQKLAEAMADFDRGRTNILLCSTIIENGLDLPNANTLIVDQATHFGLSQLYQLRGRIGRSHRQAYAYFFYHRRNLTGEAKKRLLALKQAQALGSGWQIAKRDLEIRGAGEILGHHQHGKVNSIGLNLYTRLLKQMVEELRTGQPIHNIRDISIDLPFSARLPKNITSSEVERLRLYQLLADITDPTSLTEQERLLKKKLSRKEDKTCFSNLITVFLLKILAQKTPVQSIDTVYRGQEKRPQIIVSFFGQIDYTKISDVLERKSAWQWKNGKLHAYHDQLGKDVRVELISLLDLLSID